MAEQVKELDNQQRKVVLDFIEILRQDDIKGFWQTISKVDKAYAYGGYLTAKHFGVEDTFENFIKNIFNNFKSSYLRVLENYGFSSIVRYSSTGIATVFLMPEVKTTIHYIAETEVKAFPVKLELEPFYNNGNWEFQWKICTYEHEQIPQTF